MVVLLSWLGFHFAQKFVWNLQRKSVQHCNKSGFVLRDIQSEQKGCVKFFGTVEKSMLTQQQKSSEVKRPWRHIRSAHPSQVSPLRGGKHQEEWQKNSGKQNYLCKICKRQFQGCYSYRGAHPTVQKIAFKMALRGSGIRDIAEVLGLDPSAGPCAGRQSRNLKGCSKKSQSTSFGHLWAKERSKNDGVGTLLPQKKTKYWLFTSASATKAPAKAFPPAKPFATQSPISRTVCS
jgi:transposase-like protein